MQPDKEMENLLSGLMVLDLADEKASFCSKLLADMGASVIKVEKPVGDSSRKIGPFWKNLPHPERSLFFSYNNTNKRGITLNLEHSAGKKIFLKLVQKADVIVETFPPGYLKELDIDFEVLRKVNPRLILVSVTGFGQSGPRINYKTCDLVVSAYGGQMYVCGSHDSSPLKAFGEQSYYTSSLYAAIGVLLGLRKRSLTGRGEHIDMSAQEAVVSTLEHLMVRFFYEHVIPKRTNTIYWNRSFCILPCKDGHILMTPFQHWKSLIGWLATENMAEDLEDKRWLNQDYRLSHLDHIIEVLQRWTRSHTTRELFHLGQLMGFPWAPVQSAKDILKCPQLKARRFFIDVDHAEFGTSVRYPYLPYKSSRFFRKQIKRAPFRGQDNHQIYREELGLSEKDLEELVSMGAI
jgi:crotonobetainyl-CoA:carnitine CoA-transferase CaiB-like acyl-CoA transferase